MTDQQFRALRADLRWILFLLGLIAAAVALPAIANSIGHEWPSAAQWIS